MSNPSGLTRRFYWHTKRTRGNVVISLMYAFLLVAIVLAAKYNGVIYTYITRTILPPPSNEMACYIKRLNIFQQKMHIPILMYHYVEYVQDPNDKKRQLMNIEPHVFERHLQELKAAGYKTLFVRDTPRILTGKADVCNKAVVLSFDDGYEDFYTYVFPLLKKYNAKATLYVISGYIGKPGFVSEAQIQEMLQGGLVELGSHTVDHYYLKRASIGQQKTQIFKGKKDLEDMFKIRVNTFAYPYGAYDEHTVDLVKLASFSAAVTVEPGSHMSAKDVLLMPRIRPEKLRGNIAQELYYMQK